MLTDVILAFGGYTVVLGGIAWFLGRTLLARVTEDLKLTTGTQLEAIRNELAVIRDRTGRFDSSQFEIYRDLWASLYDLQYRADRLWQTASVPYFRAFLKQLLETTGEIGRNRPLLEQEDANEIDRLVAAMWQYKAGKEKLIDLYESGEDAIYIDVTKAIASNRNWRQEYGALLMRIETSFRNRLRTTTEE